MNYRLLLIGYFSIIIQSITYSQDFWQSLDSPENLKIFDLDVNSEGSIFLACPFPTNELTGIYKSEDNGFTWSYHTNGMDTASTPHTRSIAIDNSDILIVGGTNRIYRSSDSGNYWEKVYQVTSSAYNFNVAEFGFDSIFLVGGQYDNGIIRSADNGLTWQVVLDFNAIEPDCSESITDFKFGPDGKIYACSEAYYGCSGSVYVSDDTGLSWSVFYNDGISLFNSIEFDHVGRLFVGGSGFHVYDFQLEEWEYYPYNIIAIDILVLPWNKIFVASPYNGGVGGVIYSEDNGNTFDVLNSGMSTGDARSFAVDKDGRILVAGETYNSLYRSVDTIVTGLNTNFNVFDHFTVHPNPSNGAITIESNINETANVKIVDFNGKVVGTFVIEANGQIELNSKEIKKGLYFVSIKSDSFFQIKKIIYN